MHTGTQTIKVFLEWLEKHFIHETRAQSLLVGLDPKYKTVLLFVTVIYHNAYLLVKQMCRKCIYLQTTPQSLAVGILHFMTRKYMSVHMQCLLSANAENSMRVFTLKDII
jgi:hypothetical protein